MLKTLSTYSDYISFLLVNNEAYKEILEYRLSDPAYSKALFKMVQLDVDSIREFLISKYSHTGRPALHQMEILRTLVLMVHFRCLSFREWIIRLRGDPVLCLLSGFDPKDIPGHSNLYDFVSRLYREEKKDHLLENNHFTNRNKKPKGKHEKLMTHQPETVKQLVQEYSNNPDFKLIEDDFLYLFEKLGVQFSINKGLIEDGFILNGDGSALKTHASAKGRKADEEKRYYSDVDADIGWDSDLECFYFGYTEYNLSFINHKYKIDLPLFLSLARASVHDAITSIKTLAAFSRTQREVKASYLCLDSASDNYDTRGYALSLSMIPIIDINRRNAGNNVYEQFNDISENGVPVCKNGLEMKYQGKDHTRQRHKYRCPFHKNLEDCGCPYRDECSKSAYGRTVYVKFDDDIRLFGPVPYGSKEWKKIYRDRTSTERMNQRIINDYKMKDMRMHGRKRNFFILIMIGINIHLDAFYKVSTSSS